MAKSDMIDVAPEQQGGFEEGQGVTLSLRTLDKLEELLRQKKLSSAKYKNQPNLNRLYAVLTALDIVEEIGSHLNKIKAMEEQAIAHGYKTNKMTSMGDENVGVTINPDAVRFQCLNWGVIPTEFKQKRLLASYIEEVLAGPKDDPMFLKLNEMIAEGDIKKETYVKVSIRRKPGK